MKLSLLSWSALASIWLPISFASTNSPILGPVFPKPTNLSSSPIFDAATLNFTKLVNQAIAGENSTYGPLDAQNTSFSVGLFSVDEPGLLFQYHHSAPSLALEGVQTVDADSVYRLGSVSKLLTVYTWLIQDGFLRWNQPITELVPELWAAAQQYNASSSAGDGIDRVNWAEINVEALASQFSGIGRDYGVEDVLNTPGSGPLAASWPPVNTNETLSCPSSQCTREEWFKGFLDDAPVFAPFYAPAYSNNAYKLLAYALENVTGSTFESLFEDKLVKPLNLTRTSYAKPSNDSWGVIPGNATTSMWYVDIGDDAPDGGMYSSLSDFATIGRSILSSSLISPTSTRRWLKPVSHTSNALTSVGAPWEISRYQEAEYDHLVDLYTKSGDISGYTSVLVHSPDHSVGFAVLAASSDGVPAAAVLELTNLVADVFLPALDNAAKAEADASYAGLYKSTDPNVNSSIILATEAAKPGLHVTQFIYNSTDLLPALAVAYFGATASAADLSARLYPAQLSSPAVPGQANARTRFRAVYEDETASSTGPFLSLAATWINLDAVTYANVALDAFDFELGPDGSPVALTPAFLRTTLQKA
ncbi:MAG: hypothetical protein M1819_007252 [Sarea resinae]|nr:MAG: hypothetical protein M1819_007252 [Sarea resinae]